MSKTNKTYACRACGKSGLIWRHNHNTKLNFLVEVGATKYGKSHIYTHSCPEQDMRPGKCRYCKAVDLVWVRQNSKYELTESYGLPHACNERTEMWLAHKEALREDYARTKKWFNSFPEDFQCSACKGSGFRRRHTKGANKVCIAYWKCKKCRGVGTFSSNRKRLWLGSLRQKYWPYRPWMTWKNAP